MGKHRKPRHRRGRNKEGKRQTKAEPSGPPLLSRIRHADPNTRLAALTALAGASSSSTTTRSFDATLWQAVCEQVVVRPGCSVAQLSTACVAATILADWTSGSSSGNSSDMTSTTQAQNNLTAGWPLVLQGQLQTCLQIWQDTTTNVPNRTLWGQSAWQCLYAWTCLVESNPVVMDRFQQQTQTCHGAIALLKDWLLATTTITTTTTSATTTGELLDLRHKIAETTARGLHSLLQDNPGVVEPWWDQMTASSPQDTEWLTSHVPVLLANDSNNDTTLVTRLHLVGVWMTCQSILSDASALQAPAAVGHAVRTLQEALVVPSLQRASLDEWQSSFAKATEQTQDDVLERQVVRQQTEKHEPARQIARRLAKEKSRDMKEDNDDNDDDNEDEDAMVDEEGIPKPGQLPAERHDHVQNWQDVLHNWETSLRPLELSLEIVAHLTSVAPEDSVRMEEEDGDIAMQSAVWDPVLQQHFQDLPQDLWKCFQAMHGHESASLPEPMSLHWSELQSKASTGLGHCLVQVARENQQRATILGMTRSQFWQTLWSAVKQTRVSSSGRQSALGVIVVAMQTHEAMRQEVTPDELEFLISLIQTNEESPAVMRETIVILGILCSQEEHAATVNQSVCAALLGRLERADESLVVRAEALNALMDIYRNDDCHPTVFEDLKVISHFERSLPVLKQQISRVDRQSVDPNDVEYWKETTLNVSRFIEYKHETSC